MMKASDVLAAQVRDNYGKLIASLAAHRGDITLAEDALSDAIATALQKWPESGIPDDPFAWLLRVADRKIIDRHRKEKNTDLIPYPDPGAGIAPDDLKNASDERLALMYVCAHPGIDASVRTPLMLQVVLGLPAETIASAFLVSPASMAKRLVRAKEKIRLSGIRFRIPEGEEYALRIRYVLEAIYAAYGLAWARVPGAAAGPVGLNLEAIFLARMLTEVSPQSAEAWGLLALLLFLESRSAARYSITGGYVPLSEQNPSRWNEGMIFEAIDCLQRASALNQLGPFQLEAAIQSVHAARGRTGVTDWVAITRLYEGLLQFADGVGATIAYAAALHESGATEAALHTMERVPLEALNSYQPAWALLARIEESRQRYPEARSAYERAIALTSEPPVRDWLLNRLFSLPD